MGSPEFAARGTRREGVLSARSDSPRRHVWAWVRKFPCSQVSRFASFQVRRLPGSQVSRFASFHVQEIIENGRGERQEGKGEETETKGNERKGKGRGKDIGKGMGRGNEK